MGEVAVGEGRTESFNSTDYQDRKTRCAPAVGHEDAIPIDFFQLSCDDDDALNHKNISLLQRVDRLDNVLTAMEDKVPTEENSSSVTSPPARRRPSSLDNRYRCKSTESVLEEVEEKGTLVERVTELEKRIYKLQRRMCTKSIENSAIAQVASSAHSMTPHDQAISHCDDDQQSSQDLADVEKHEVTTALSSVAIPGQHREPLTCSEKNGIISQKGETPHMEDHEGMVSSDQSTSVDEQDPRVYQKQSKKKSLRIKKWLSKRLHISFPGTTQVEAH